MDKFKNFCKKPLMIISIIIMCVFFISIFILLCIPKGKVYSYEYKVEDVNYRYEVELTEKYKTKHICIIDGQEYNLAKVEAFDYEVDAGKLYLLDGATSNRQEIAEINSRKLNLIGFQFGEENNSVLYCNVNCTLFYIFITGFVIGLIFFSVSLTLKLIDAHNNKTNMQEDAGKDIFRE